MSERTGSDLPERAIQLGFSTCPNDTFMFHGLVHGQVDIGSLGRASFEPVMLDIEALNLRAMDVKNRLPVTKLSVHAYAHLIDDYSVLSAGAALGRGCGPLVVVRDDNAKIQSLEDLSGVRLAIPGKYTSANFLVQTFGPAKEQVQPIFVEMRFDKIMSAVEEGQVDAGVIIHESRFSYPDHGLRCLADLGELWEEQSGFPLPLGLIAVSREWPIEEVHDFQNALRASVELAFQKPELSRDWIRQYAQEMDDDICRRHIELYVNHFSVDLSEEGRQAIDRMLQMAWQRGIAPESQLSPWR